VPALIDLPCPIVMPQPSAVNRPNPKDPCGAVGPIAADWRAVVQVWTSRSRRPVSPEEYASAWDLAPLGAGSSRYARSPAREADQSRSPSPHSFEESPVEQLALAFKQPGIGHNQPSEAIDPIDGLNAQLMSSHSDLLERFGDLELACARVPNPI